MRVLVAIKRVPAVGGKVVLTEDGTSLDTRLLGFTTSPYEECALEEAVRLVEGNGGESVVLSVGEASAAEQLRYGLALGIDRAILVETPTDAPLGPKATAAEIVAAVRADEEANGPFDLLLFGNEAPDTGDFQVGIRVARALERPVVGGIKSLSIADGQATASRDRGRGQEVYRVPLPAVITVREGLNTPRYPSMPGRIKAKKKPLDTRAVSAHPDAWSTTGLRLPEGDGRSATLLGNGAAAAPNVVDTLVELGVLVR